MSNPTAIHGLLHQLASRPRKFRFKQFQREDLARAALKDGAILSWDTGLGKTIAAFAWPMLKGARRVLIVAPEGLHAQIRDTGRRFFNALVLPLDSIARLEGWKLDRPAADIGRPLFWLTTYQQLGHNGADEWKPRMDAEGVVLNQTVLRERREKWLVEQGIAPTEEHHNAVGEEKLGITCVWRPSLARIIAHYDSFDCVVVDEGTKLQANDSHIGLGVRLLQPRFRLVMTATPVKNRLESFFWLGWWAAGGQSEATALWPYEGTSEAREEFGNHHLQMDRFVTRESEHFEEHHKNRRFQRRSARVCNIHRLWKLIAPLVVRRTKANCGEEIVARILRPVKALPGAEQWRIYTHLLENPPKFTSGGKEMGHSAVAVQIGFLRQAALCPWGLQTARVLVRDVPLAYQQFNPKLMLVLTLIAECLERGEQVMVGSPFRLFSQRLHTLLVQAGARVELLDGETPPAKRAVLADAFKNRGFDVMCAGMGSMAEGHSLECCPNLILPALDWPYDVNKQFLDRVWRINSPKPVNIYLPIVQGTVDERLSQLFADKSDSSGLVLDGELPEDCVEELDLFALLRDVEAIKAKGTNVVDEAQLSVQWPELRERLRVAGR